MIANLSIFCRGAMNPYIRLSGIDNLAPSLFLAD